MDRGRQDRGKSHTRRTFLKTTAATGLTASASPLLSGCGLPRWLECLLVGCPKEKRERRTLHFDLSHMGANTTFTLRIARSSSNGMKLKRHTAASRACCRKGNTVLQQIPDERLTHYAEDVDLPADACQHWYVSMQIETDTGPVEAVVMTSIHIPSYAWRHAAQRRRAKVESGLLTHALSESSHTFLRTYGVQLPEGVRSGQDIEATAQVLTWINDINTWIAAGKSLVFHHPDIMNLDPKIAALVDPAIEVAPSFTLLVNCIMAQGPAGVSNGYLRIVPSKDPDGNPVIGPDGKPVYEQVPSDQTNERLGDTIDEVKALIFDDADFQDQQWHPADGFTMVGPDGVAPGLEAPAAATNYALHDAVGSRVHGIRYYDFQVTDAASRAVRLTVDNLYLRCAAAWAQYLDADGNVLPLANPGEHDIASRNSQYLDDVNSNSTIMGIPLTGDLLEKTKLNITLPADATSARIIFGSLGVGGGAFSEEAANPSAWTLVLNIGIPTLLLSLGVGLQSSKWISDLLKDPDIKWAIAGILFPIITGGEAIHAYFSGSIRPVIIDVANVIVSLVIMKIPALLARILAYATAEELVQAIPFVGWAVKALSIGATVSQIGQTVGEVQASPAIFDNTLSAPMNTQVTIKHDPKDTHFPLVARKYVVRALYGKKTTRYYCGKLTGTTSADIVVNFTNVPEGGTVQIETWFLSDDDWIAGYGGVLDNTGKVGPIPNTPESAGAVTVTITENQVPLTKNTKYSPYQKLTYAGGAHHWSATSAPTATRGDLDCASNTGLCSRVNLTVSQLTGMLGYGFLGGGQTHTCDNTGGATLLYTLRNISLNNPPDDGLKTSGCGYVQMPAMAYDLMGPASGRGKNFFIDARNGDYHVRSIVLDKTTPMDTHQIRSWGRFSQVMNAVAVHPAGYIVGVNTSSHKMEIIKLEDEPKPDDTSVMSTLKAGPGTRVGLLNSPVAISVTPDGTIVVLEAGNNRIQAFDVTGNAVAYFADKTSSTMPLKDPPNTAVYLDMKVEAAGYLYVLGYTGTGLQPADYFLDVYKPDGVWLSRTEGVPAARIAVDYWRTVYSLNYESFVGPNGLTEPSLSQWTPSTPGSDAPNTIVNPSICGS